MSCSAFSSWPSTFPLLLILFCFYPSQIIPDTVFDGAVWVCLPCPFFLAILIIIFIADFSPQIGNYMHTFSLNVSDSLTKELMVSDISACSTFDLKWSSFISLFMLWTVVPQVPCFMTLILHFRQEFMCPIGFELDLEEEPTSKWNYSFLWKVPALLS